MWRGLSPRSGPGLVRQLSSMVAFISFIAFANLAIGYALAVYVRGRKGRSLREFVYDLGDTTPHICVAASITAQRAIPHHDEALVHHNAPEAVSKNNPQFTKPVSAKGGSGLVTKDYVEQLLAELTTTCDPLENPASVVLVELDAGGDNVGVSEGRLLSGITNTLRELLSDAQTAARFNDRQLFLLLPGDDETVATQRAERARQRIEATEFLVDEKPVRATVSCALAQVSTDYSVDDLLSSLNETLAEAKRLGGNQTFLYDGMTPSPVVPPELNMSPKTCAI
jgi:diguanylate cyclase (GGDEF)-like protein